MKILSNPQRSPTLVGETFNDYNRRSCDNG
uniref:Uncharacterized protein n=1 Tax=Siphoviridae sp. ctnPP24 TaxID=2825662 RepID=A0A8S5TYZ1_9CAUD|nr:MAG TPA: hypothetical protein [Siphoviridae sp. ctnPP24]